MLWWCLPCPAPRSKADEALGLRCDVHGLDEDLLMTELIPMAEEVVVEVLEVVADVVVHDWSCNMERLSRSGKRPFGPLVSSEKFSLSSLGELPLPMTNSVDSGCRRQQRSEGEVQVKLEKGMLTDPLRDLWPLRRVRLLGCSSRARDECWVIHVDICSLYLNQALCILWHRSQAFSQQFWYNFNQLSVKPRETLQFLKKNQVHKLGSPRRMGEFDRPCLCNYDIFWPALHIPAPHTANSVLQATWSEA